MPGTAKELEMADAKHAPYVRGKQDIRENQHTFKVFWDITVWSVVSILILLAALAYFFPETPPAH
jgi:hypothetical protein